MANRNRVQAITVLLSLVAGACDDRMLDFTSISGEPGGAHDAGAASILAGSGGGSALNTSGRGGQSATSSATACEADHWLSAEELESIQAAACNAWSVEMEANPPLSSCLFEIPSTSADGSHDATLTGMNVLLRSSDGPSARLPDNSQVSNDCDDGYRLVGTSQLQLNAHACIQLNAGDTALVAIFGCAPGQFL